MDHVVSRLPITAQTSLPSRFSPYDVCGTKIGFFQSTLHFYYISVILQGSILVFIVMFLYPAGQTWEIWEASNKVMFFKEKETDSVRIT